MQWILSHWFLLYSIVGIVAMLGLYTCYQFQKEPSDNLKESEVIVYNLIISILWPLALAVLIIVAPFIVINVSVRNYRNKKKRLAEEASRALTPTDMYEGITK